MDGFDMAELAASVSQQPLPFGSFPQPSHIKRQQTYPNSFSVPLYSPIEDFSAADFTTDSAPSPGSPLSPVFNNNYALPSGDEWVAWDKLEQSPESDEFLKSETLDSPDLSSIPIMSPALNPMELSNSTVDDVVFGREGVNDTRPLFQSPQVNFSNNNSNNNSSNMSTPLSNPQQARPAGLQTSSASQSPSLPAPEPSITARRYPARSNSNSNTLKRKSSDDNSSSTPSSPRSSCSPPPLQRRHTSSASGSTPKEDAKTTSTTTTLGPKKTAHNMIEKRYRTNLNDKIAALRDSVPALRIMVHRLEHADANGRGSGDDVDQPDGVLHDGTIRIKGEFEAEDLGGLAPAHKLNKATILSKATEYIAHLERKNRNLAKENAALRNRVEGFEMLVMSRGGARGGWN